MTAMWIFLALTAVAALALIVWRVAASRRPADKAPPPPRYVCDRCNETDCECSKEDDAR